MGKSPAWQTPPCRTESGRKLRPVSSAAGVHVGVHAEQQRARSTREMLLQPSLRSPHGHHIRGLPTHPPTLSPPHSLAHSQDESGAMLPPRGQAGNLTVSPETLTPGRRTNPCRGGKCGPSVAQCYLIVGDISTQVYFIFEPELKCCRTFVRMWIR